MDRFFSLVFIFFFIFSNCFAQKKYNSYINKFSVIAIEEMKKNGIPASVKLAQGILESSFGKSMLAVEGNNHFGIKCHGWSGKKIYADDDEKDECFRRYDNPNDSYKDHSLFLIENKRYRFLFDLNINDYKSWCNGIAKAGYATDTNYSKKLISIIEKYNLFVFDNISNKWNISHTFGFPFIHGISLGYNLDNFSKITAEINSSFLINNFQLLYELKVIDKVYIGLSIDALLYYNTNDKASIVKGLTPQISLINNIGFIQSIDVGLLISSEKIYSFDYFPVIGFKYQIN
tara:strand:- start:7139 stop:8005 length:867 start_codon:yes stop_codon:yes gene_type:complete